MFYRRIGKVFDMSLTAHVQASVKRASWVDTKLHSLASSLLSLSVVGSLMVMIYVPHVANWPLLLDELFGFVGVGIASHSLGVLGHETYHDSFFRSKRANELIGAWVFHYPLLGRYSLLKEVHLRHHRFFGTELDPDRDHWGFEPRSPEHRAHLLKTITGITFLESIRGFLSREVKGSNSPLGSTLPPTSKADLLGIAVSQIAILGVVLTTTDWWRFPLQWLLPTVTVGALVEHLRVFCEHNEGRLRVFGEPSIVGVLVFGRAGFRLHAVHHQAPSVPWFALGSKYETVSSRLGDKLDVSANYITQIRKI